MTGSSDAHTFTESSAQTGLWSDSSSSPLEYKTEATCPASRVLHSTRSHHAGARRFLSGRSSYSWGIVGAVVSPSCKHGESQHN